MIQLQEKENGRGEKMVFSIIVGFFSGIITGIFAILFHNRRTAQDPGNNYRESEESVERMESEISDLETRTRANQGEYEEAKRTIEEIRNGKENLENSNTN